MLDTSFPVIAENEEQRTTNNEQRTTKTHRASRLGVSLAPCYNAHGDGQRIEKIETK
jgi:hypothetical protein